MRNRLALALFWLAASCVTSEPPEPAEFVGPPAPAVTLAPLGAHFLPAAPQSAVTPTSRQAEPKWVELFDKIAAEAAATPASELVFVGDSITQGWRHHTDLWTTHFAKYHPVNAGIWSDGTQHLLWRLQHGQLAGLDRKTPRLAVLLIGTNNGGATARAIAEGIYANIGELRREFPQPPIKILVLGIFPSGADPQSKRRLRNIEVNAMMKTVANDKDVFFLDLGGLFVAPDGTIPAAISPDQLHLTRKGFELWAGAMAPKIHELLKPPSPKTGPSSP